ncbi:MAG TPA: sulfatase-like hydrolase/transferase [Acidimicrobiales bacterium]|nr:sulfatase-like hydrolase/transferase [Acidimicrobiales bacterium]
MTTLLGTSPSRIPRWGALPALLELLTLCAFVVAQPVLGFLARGSELLIFRDAGPADIVLMVVVVTLGPPLVLFVLEVTTGFLFSSRARSSLHLAFVAGLVGTFALQLLQRTVSPPGLAVLALSALTAVLAAAVYVRWEPIRLWMRLASPAPVVFASLFLFTSPVSGLLTAPGHVIASNPGGTALPVVLMVLDELPLASLLDQDGTIDARLYPNIAALARDATFFRNATGAAARTTHALPAMLTGRFPAEGRAPVTSQYPGNLFALLAHSHDLHVFESVTALCPREVCPSNEWGSTPRRNLLQDAGHIWARTLAPGGLVGAASWFGEDTVESTQGSRGADDAFFLLERIQDDQMQHFGRFLASIDGNGTPFHFVHLLLPHAPWHYLPDGTEYDDRPLGMVDYEQRTSEPWPALVNHQRHVLQAMSVDRLVGAVLARLKQVGLYDRATVLLTADHGMSFSPAPPAATRVLLPENQHEVAWVPFLLKAPGQTSGEVRDDNVMGVDVAPTVAALAGVRIPWEVDGISVVEGRRDDRAKAWFNEPGERLEIDPGAFTKVLEGAPSRIMDLGREGRGPYVLREVADLVGLDLATVVEPDAAAVTARIDDLSAYHRVEPAPRKVPALLTGHLVAEHRTAAPAAVVVVVNGEIAGASKLYAEGDQPHRFALMLDPRSFQAGTNSVRLFSVEGRAGEPRLRSIATVGG